MKTIQASLFLLLLVSFSGSAETPVEVISDASSVVGKVLTSAIAGKIAESDSLRLTKTGEDRLQLRILAMDQFGASPGVGTAYSFSVTWSGVQAPMPIYFDQRLGYCGSDRIETCASGVIDLLEKHAAAIEKARSSATER